MVVSNIGPGCRIQDTSPPDDRIEETEPLLSMVVSNIEPGCRIKDIIPKFSLPTKRPVLMFVSETNLLALDQWMTCVWKAMNELQGGFDLWQAPVHHHASSDPPARNGHRSLLGEGWKYVFRGRCSFQRRQVQSWQEKQQNTPPPPTPVSEENSVRRGGLEAAS